MKKFTLFFMPLFLLFLFVKTELTAQVVFNQSTPGIYTFTVASPTLYKIETWGGGGRGGPRANNNGGAGGGGGGAYSTSTLLLAPGTYNIKVGKGGLDPGNADGDSSYIRNGTLLVLAMGGSGVNANNATGGLGGQAAAGIGTTKYSGGNGANGTVTPATTLYGGGGGSSAGTGSNGNNGSTSTGGPAPVGGAKGGDGRTLTDGAGSPGNNPGGAGGGARKTVSGGGQQNGGIGGAGMVVITLACLPPSIQTPASDSTVECDGSGNAAELAAWLGNHGGAVAINGCGTLTWANNFSGLSDDCGATGSATVTFTVTDSNGSTATTSATFTIEDTTAPDAVCQDITIEFDAYGNASITADDIDNGSSDACGSVTIAIDTSEYSCTDLGDNTVTLTVTDECGNSSTCTATVTVIVPLEWRCHDNEKVIFCHVPPNYPAQNIQEICVSMDVETICDHLGHGDHFGECDGTEVGFQQITDNAKPIATLDESATVAGDNGLKVTTTRPVNLDIRVQPNPFSSKATLHFNLAKSENVVLKVFNNMGQEVSSLYSGQLDAGQHSFEFDGTLQSEGMFHFSLVVGSKVENVRMILDR